MKILLTPIFFLCTLFSPLALANGVYQGTLSQQEQQWYFIPCNQSTPFKLDVNSPSIEQQLTELAQQYPSVSNPAKQADFWLIIKADNHSDWHTKFILEPTKIVAVYPGGCSLEDYLKQIAP